jgi:outer membrane protein TolC
MMNKIVLLGFSMFLSLLSNGQQRMELSLSEAYQLLEKQYPVLQNTNLLDQIYQKDLSSIAIDKLPTVMWYADGRFQSQSTSLNSDGAMTPIEIDQPLVSLKTYVEANYNVLDGGVNTVQRKLKEVQLAVDQQNVEVDRFALQERINQLFINIVVLREQTKLLDFSLEDLEARKEIIDAGVELGTVLESEAFKIEVKILELSSSQDNLLYRINGLVNSLSQLTGEDLATEVQLTFPEMPAAQLIPAIDRPEQKLFQLQREAILAQADMIEAQKKPKLGAYAQAGVGYPNPLNILDNNIAPYAVVGARFGWQITDWKKSKIEKEILSLQTQKLINAEATLEFNIASQEANYLANVERLNVQIQEDEKIAKLQSLILKQLAAQLDEGVITSIDYINQVNSELSARQKLSIHQIELLKLQLEFLNERGYK